ncbi:MAG: daunorubicin biosynthesis sensory transduction protein DnrJ [Thermodesulfovibrio sp.]|nr:daunorubicin biosynthesis sensory transduction protein DnrJ [Thermodesulfovibrio sp.]
MIRYWQYLHEYEPLRKEILAVVDRVFSSGNLILGSEVAAFEKNFAGLCGVACGVGVNSGTDALFLSLRALGVSSGDEVITVANTAVPTIAAIRATGALPVFVDVEPDTFLMNVSQVDAAVTEKTRCIIPVHLFGQPVDMDPLCEIANRNSLPVLEDCAQATGARYRGKAAGSIGDIGAFSFYPTKVLGAYGDAGMAVTSRPELHAHLRRLRFYGMEGAYYAEEEGYNSRLDEVQAAILNFLLPRVKEYGLLRQAVAADYSAALAGVGDLELPLVRPDRTHQFYAYTIKTAQRDGLRQYLQDHGIETRINYPVPVHLMRGYNFLGYKPGALPVTEMLAERILSLPLYPGLSEDSIACVVMTIKNFFAARKS